MKLLAKFIGKFASQKAFRLAMLLFFISTFLINNPWFGQKHLVEATNGLGMIDMNMVNTSDGILSHLKDFGTLGRSIYQRLLLLDYVLIITLGAFQTISILRLLNNVSPKLEWLIIFPIARGIFDGVENILLYISAGLYPSFNMWLLKLASGFIFLKWVAFGITIVILLGLAIINLYQILIRRKNHMKKNIKLVVLTSSPRKDSLSKQLANHVQKGATASGATVEIIDLYQSNLAYCTGCLKCMETGYCILNDDFEAIKQKMYEADGFILSAPTYCGTYNAVMKNFIDRLGLYERFTSSLGNKYIGTISTAGDKRAANSTAQSMATLLSNGIFARSYISGTLGVSARFDIDDTSALDKLFKDASNLGKKMVTDIEKAANYPAQNIVFRVISKLVLRPMYTRMIKKNKDTNTKGVYQNLAARNLI